MNSKFFVTAKEKKKEPAVIPENGVSKLLHKNIKEYAIDVVEDRALESYKDGMKPSQRRLIKALVDAGAFFNRSTVKSAKIVGDTMGRYHPHGDLGIYGALATLVNSNYPIVFGQGNWGTLTDGPAASRYTECKLSELGMKYIEGLEVAEMVPNYSGECMEPVEFPTRVPSFFINRCDGIAVGIACHIPDHNLGEIVDAFKTVVKKGDKTTTADILKHIKGPDWKYGGKILSTPEEIAEVYDNGKGSIRFECEYNLSKQGTKTVLTITGYCPKFSPKNFQDEMIKLIESGDVVYANDSSTKTEPCKFEVIMKNEATFEAKIHKHLITSMNYQFYALDRSKSNAPDRDVDTKIISPNFVTLMKMWVDYRRTVETKLIDLEISKLNENWYKNKCRLEAVKNLNTIKSSLEVSDPEDYLDKHLPLLKRMSKIGNVVGSSYISDLKLSSIRKIDEGKIEKEIANIEKELEKLNNDKNNIDKVIIKHLDELKHFSKPRILKTA